MSKEFDNKEQRELTSSDVDSSGGVFVVVSSERQNHVLLKVEKEELKSSMVDLHIANTILPASKITKWRVSEANFLIIGGC